jgi:formate hydrogenlyase subunit 6/NADH:ubiquinone oxidoreductase subunit I
MLNTLKNRFEQGCRTSAYPKTTIELPERYRGQHAQPPAPSKPLMPIAK